MSLKLVRPGESLPTEDPVADERSLPTVPPEVGPEVGSFTVDLVTAGDVTNVLFLPGSSVRPAPVDSLPVLAVGAGAGHAPQPRLASGTCGLEFE